MSNVISTGDLQTGMQQSKNYTNAKVREIVNALINDLQVFEDLYELVTTLGLYIDSDGDLCQREDSDSESEEEGAENGN